MTLLMFSGANVNAARVLTNVDLDGVLDQSAPIDAHRLANLGAVDSTLLGNIAELKFNVGQVKGLGTLVGGSLQAVQANVTKVHDALGALAVTVATKGHQHSISNITGLQLELDMKASESVVLSSLALKANLADISPNLEPTVTALQANVSAIEAEIGRAHV